MDIRLEITADDLERMRGAKEDFFLIDIRDRDAFEEGHLSGAMQISLIELEDKLKGIRRDRSIVLYCHVGATSKEACIALSRSGWTNVKTLRGGYEGWKS